MPSVLFNRTGIKHMTTLASEKMHILHIMINSMTYCSS